MIAIISGLLVPHSGAPLWLRSVSGQFPNAQSIFDGIFRIKRVDGKDMNAIHVDE